MNVFVFYFGAEETPSVLSTSRSSVLPSLVPYSSASKQPPSLPKSGSRRGRIRMSASGIDKSRKSSHTGAQRSFNTSSTAFQTLQDLLLAIRPPLQPQYETEMVPMRPDEEDLMTPVPSTAPSSRLDTASSSRVLRSSEGYGSPRFDASLSLSLTFAFCLPVSFSYLWWYPLFASSRSIFSTPRLDFVLCDGS